jgi:ergothioneine biosynthesis protein EgtB
MTVSCLESLSALAQGYLQVRRDSERLAAPFTEADQTVQSMPDASPMKWHLAHTSWFFETFVLKQYQRDYSPYNEQFKYLFNSYYNGVGTPFARANRGVISRPGKEEVVEYRHYVDEAILQLFESFENDYPQGFVALVELGLAHEQQHQELLVTDIQHAFSMNPIPQQITQPATPFPQTPAMGWLGIDEGLYQVGHEGDDFCFDNEMPKHKVYLQSFRVSNRLITNGEYLAFMNDNGYENSNLWLSEGWAWKNNENIHAPLYWRMHENVWVTTSLSGMQALDLNAPVMHISFFEANAFATWANARLATEFEWEVVSQLHPKIDTHINPSVLKPQPLVPSKNQMHQLFNTLWQWTASQYMPYPGFEIADGAVGEYNGKFMSNQFVLRGGSCASPLNHIRATYRNFFPATARWQFTGIRLVKND